MISPATIEEIKNKMDIVEVVGDFVTLKRSGSSYKALSPFSNEKTPSFYVVPSKGIFKDFSSGKGGDAITFVMEVDGLSYVEALKYLAKKYGITIEEEVQGPEVLEAQNKRESLYIVLNFAKEFFKKNLHEHEEGKSIGLSYFKERGMSDLSIQEFELGYSLQEWDALLKEATKSGYNPELLEEAGLIISKEEGKTYDRFRNRVIFPIHNGTGKVVAFGARIMVADKKQPKYINSPETELYNKSKILYGLFQAKQAIRQADNCFLVEGYTDVISMHQAGVKNVVSSSGTALTDDQIKLIRRYTETITVIYDGDAAGIKASIRGIDMLLEGGLNVKAVVLPEGEDPDSYVKALGTSAFAHFVESASQDFIQFKTKLFLDDTKGDPIKKAGLIRDIVESISKIADPIKRTIYLNECSNLLNMNESVLITELNKILIKNAKDRKAGILQEPPLPLVPAELLLDTPDPIDQQDITRIIELQERESIRILVNYGKSMLSTSGKEDQELVNYYLSEIEQIEFATPIYREIITEIKTKLEEGIIIEADYLLANGSESVKRAVAEMIIPKHEISENWEKKFKIHVPHEREQLRDVTYSNILRLKFRVVQHLIEKEKKKLKEAKTDKESDELLDEIAHLKKIEVSIAKILGNVTVK